MTQTIDKQGCCEKKACCAKTQTIRPLQDRVLVKRLQVEEKVRGGIIVPTDSTKKKQEKAEVIAVGPGKKDKNGECILPPVKVGDIILMEKYSGQDVEMNDQEYVIVRGDDIIAVVE